MFYSYINLVLFCIILISKEILIFNEEVLVLFAFCFFVYLLTNYAGNLVVDELDNRSMKIKEEFDLYKNLQKKTLLYLVKFHKKQNLLSQELKEILSFSKYEILILEKSYPLSLRKQIIMLTDDQLKRILANESRFSFLAQKHVFSRLVLRF